ncbi:MAG: glutathione S-transferase N-terminal domain-containing protein [Defluviicoccus sp.]|nr:glutathione S-transferase N-terminal domain-containing protein [Defluviicoccus sp.]MDE0275962.1 glutathione S-transferase N-terminal domain-containing protein [Defluviicoccus sp.]
MIDLYFWTTDNGYKARQMVEETGFDYTIRHVNLRRREQFDPGFLKISPGHKIPAIVDRAGPDGRPIALCESGAILKYLAEKAGGGLYPDAPRLRARVDQWFFYGSATLTPLAQQFNLFAFRFETDVPQVRDYYLGVMRDLLSILDGHLAQNQYLAGDYSIADIACYPDVHIHGTDVSFYSDTDTRAAPNMPLDEFPNVRRWHDAIEARPAVRRAWADLKSVGMPPRGYA